MGSETFGYGALALAAVVIAAAVLKLRTKVPALAGAGVGIGLLLAVVGGATLLGRGYGFDAEQDRPLLGLVTVFTTVAGFGLVVTTVMLLIE